MSLQVTITEDTDWEKLTRLAMTQEVQLGSKSYLRVKAREHCVTLDRISSDTVGRHATKQLPAEVTHAMSDLTFMGLLLRDVRRTQVIGFGANIFLHVDSVRREDRARVVKALCLLEFNSVSETYNLIHDWLRDRLPADNKWRDDPFLQEIIARSEIWRDRPLPPVVM